MIRNNFLFSLIAVLFVCLPGSLPYPGPNSGLLDKEKSGLIYLNSTKPDGSFGGVIRIMLEDQVVDSGQASLVDKTYAGAPEDLEVYSVNGSLSYVTPAHERDRKRLGIRACCSSPRWSDARQVPEVEMGPHTSEEDDVDISEEFFTDEEDTYQALYHEGKKVTLLHSDNVTVTESAHHLNELARSYYRQAILPSIRQNNGDGWSWWDQFSLDVASGTASGAAKAVLKKLANTIYEWYTKEEKCFDTIATWVSKEKSVSFHVRGSGVCSMTAIQTTYYDALVQVVGFWKERKLTRACGVLDHEGGGRLEFSMSAQSIPARNVYCGNKEFYACKRNENGWPSCSFTHSIHDEL